MFSIFPLFFSWMSNSHLVYFAFNIDENIDKIFSFFVCLLNWHCRRWKVLPISSPIFHLPLSNIANMKKIINIYRLIPSKFGIYELFSFIQSWTWVNYFLRIFIIVFQVPGGAGSDIWRWPGKTSNQVFIFIIIWSPYNLIDQNIKNYHQNHHHYLSETVRTWLQWSILNAAWRNLSGFNLKKNFCNAELWCASLMCSF